MKSTIVHIDYRGDKVSILQERLKDAMKARNMSASELARRSGLSTGMISQLLKGVRGKNVTWDTITRLSRALGVSAMYFSEEDDGIIGPSELLSYMTKEQKEFVVTKENLPFIILSMEAKRSGLSKEEVSTLGLAEPIYILPTVP